MNRELSSQEKNWYSNLRNTVSSMMGPAVSSMYSELLDEIFDEQHYSWWRRGTTHGSADFREEYNYESMETLGDKVISLAMIQLSLLRDDALTPRQLSSMDDTLTSNEYLATRASLFGIDTSVIRIAERLLVTIGNERVLSPSDASDAFEAIFGTIKHVTTLVRPEYADIISSLTVENVFKEALGDLSSYTRDTLATFISSMRKRVKVASEEGPVYDEWVPHLTPKDANGNYNVVIQKRFRRNKTESRPVPKEDREDDITLYSFTGSSINHYDKIVTILRDNGFKSPQGNSRSALLPKDISSEMAQAMGYKKIILERNGTHFETIADRNGNMKPQYSYTIYGERDSDQYTSDEDKYVSLVSFRALKGSVVPLIKNKQTTLQKMIRQQRMTN